MIMIRERGFSCMKRMKSNWRSTQGSVQPSRLMYLSLEGPSLSHETALAVNRWSGSRERSRQPGFAAQVNQPTNAELERELEDIEASMRRK